jgi:hypothetical protein
MSKGKAFEVPIILRQAACRLAVCLVLFTAHPVQAGDDQGGPSQEGRALNPAAVICVNPVSGEDLRIQFGKGQHIDCPAEHTTFIAFEVEQSPGADPLPFDPQQQEEQAEVRDAPMDRN